MRISVLAIFCVVSTVADSTQITVIGDTTTFSCYPGETVPAWLRHFKTNRIRSIAFGDSKQSWFTDSRYVIDSTLSTLSH